MDMTKRYLKAAEAAEYMNVCINTARKYAAEWGAMSKIGRINRYDKKVIDAKMGRAEEATV